MPSPMRLKRISDRIQQDLSEMLLFNIQDPIGMGMNVYESVLKEIQDQIEKHWKWIVE